jgi:heat shock protein HtpX
MINTIILLGTLTGILLAAGFFFGGILGMTAALTLAFLINFFSYWYSDRIVLRIYKAEPLDDAEINSIVKRLALNARVPKPDVYIVPADAPNAFATGRDPKHSAIAVTKGLLDLEKEEIEGVLAHEMAHIKNRDTLVQTVAATIAGAVAYIAQISYWSIFLGGGRRGGESLLGLVFIIVFAPLAALFIRMSISRQREYKADWTGAIITRNPRGLASALRKISAYVSHRPMKGPSATSHLFIVNPFRSDWFTNLFATHPPIEKRIEKLEEMHLG